MPQLFHPFSRRALRWGLMALLALPLGACLKAQPADEDPDVQALETAQGYVKALLQEDLQSTLALSDYPFLLDGEQVVPDAQGLKAIYTGIFANKDLTQLKVIRVMPFELAHIQSKQPAFYQQLMAGGYQGLRAVLAYLDTPDSLEPEGVLLFLALDAENRWRVVGFRD